MSCTAVNPVSHPVCAIKFLIDDEHAFIREAMHGVLHGLQADEQVVEAGDAQTALQTLQTHPDTDLVLFDAHLPDQHGRQVLATVAVAMLSGDKDPATIHQELAGGAQGFLSTTETPEVLSSALAHLLSGGVYMPTAATKVAMDLVSSERPGRAAAARQSNSSRSRTGAFTAANELLSAMAAQHMSRDGASVGHWRESTPPGRIGLHRPSA